MAAEFLDESAITGVASKVSATTPSKQTGSSAFLDEATITGVQSTAPKQSAIEQVGRAGLAAADMVLGLPGMALGVGMDIGTRLDSLFRGKSRKETETAINEVGQYVPDWMAQPLQTALGVKAYDQKIIEDVVEKSAGIVDNLTKGFISTTDAKSLFNVVMLGAGTKGLSAEVAKIGVPGQEMPAGAWTGKGPKPPGPPEVPKPAELGTEAYRQPVVPSSSTLTPEEAIAASKKRIQDTKAALKAETPAARAAREATTIIPEGPATWMSGGEEFPVKVTGEPVKGPDGKIYTPVSYNGTDSFIPTVELSNKVAVPKVEAQVGLPKPVEIPTEPKTRLVEGRTLDELRAGASPLDSGLAKMKEGRAFDIDAVEKIALDTTFKAGGRIIDTNGKPIGSGFQNGQVDPRLLAAMGITSAAVWAALNPEDMEKLTGLGLIGTTAVAMTGKSSAFGPVIKRLAPYTDPVFQNLSKLGFDGHTELPIQTIREQLGKTSGEAKKIFERILAQQEGKTISAHDMADGWLQETAGWRMSHEETFQYSDYGLDRIGRLTPNDVRQIGGNEGLNTVKDVTVKVRLPEYMQMTDANHFSDDRLFGWFRAFEEDGKLHVVETQSDLAQHAKGAVPEAQIEGISAEILKNNAEIERLNILHETPNEWGPGDSSHNIRRRREAVELRVRELQNKLTATAIDSQLSPIIKDWPRKITREALLWAAKKSEGIEQSMRHYKANNADGFYTPEITERTARANNYKTVRFASADTVALVEGWPDRNTGGVVALRRQLQESITRFEAANMPEAAARERVRLAEVPTQEGSRFQPEYQGIYNRYAGEITRYYKALGGIETRDALGHTWWEVPVEGAVQKTSAGPMIKQLGQATPEQLAKIAAGVAAGAYLLSNSDSVKELALAGIVGVTAAKGGLKGMLEADLIKTAGEGGAKAQAAFTELYRRNEPQLRRSVANFARQGVDLDDVVQRTFINAFQSIDPKNPNAFRGDSKFSTYLHTIGQREALKRVAYEKNRPTTEITPEMEETVGHQETPATIAQNKLLGNRLEQAMERLDPRFREAFMFAEVEGLDYTTIAEKTGVPIGTVKSRVFRAKEDLRSFLRDYADGDIGKERFGQSGQIDSKVLAGIAAVSGGAALGAYLNPEHPLQGAFFGVGAGAALMHVNPAKFWQAIKAAQSELPIVRIDDMARSTVAVRKVAERAAYKVSSAVQHLVPEVARREAIFRHLDGDTNVQLTGPELTAAEKVRDFYTTLGSYAKDAGVVKEILQNYATHIYGPEAASAFASKFIGTSTTLDSPFGKRRIFPTLAEAEAAGFKPITTDIAEVIEAYSRSITNAVENRRYIQTLKEATDFNDNPLIMKEGKASRDYVFIDHPQLRGFRVHPDVAGDLRMTFGQMEAGPILKGLDAINTTQKRSAVSLSLFHASALEQAMVGATALLKSPLRGPRILGQGFAPALFGENLMIKMAREGGAGDLVDLALRNGLEFGFERSGSVALEELRSNFYNVINGTTKFLDDAVPQLGTQTVGRFAQLNQMFDRAMWGRFHAALKLETFADKVSELSRNNARAVSEGRAKLASQDEIARRASSFVNDAYGGLNWQGIAQEFSSRWGRAIATTAMNPAGRFGMRMVLFAPDWTISTTRAFVKAFGPEGVATGTGAVIGTQLDPENKGIGAAVGAVAGFLGGKAAGLKGTQGSGLRGLYQPETLVDLHRQYIMRSAFIYSTIVDAVNYQMSGHHVWENKDPTRLDRGDGTTQQVSKHTMEPIHWLLTPRQQAMNKLSFVVKEPLAQLQDVEYLSTHGAPRMGGISKGSDIPLGTRIGHAAKAFSPIAVQQNFDSNDPARAISSFVGMPVYGHTYEEQTKKKVELKALRASPEYKALAAARKAAKENK